MSGLSIHEKRQLAEQLAREQLSKSGQYRFGIPQSVLNAKANEFMRLSDKEIQQKFNEYFQSTGLNAKPKDLWDSMGLNLEQKKKAEAHMKGLQKQINKKYMRPATSNKKKTGAKQAKNILPNDVKKEIRQFMVALLKQAFNQKSEEFRNYLLNNKGGFAEGAMELHDLGSAFADKLTEIGIVVERGDTRAEIREKLIKKQAEIDVLESYIGDEKSFNELFKKYFNENFDYQSTFDYICASSEFTTQDSSKKIEKFNKKFSDLTKTNLKSADDYMGNASGAGGLMDLAFNVALMYVSGGSSAIAKYAQMTAKGGTEIAENAITKVVGKKLAQSSAGQAMSQGVGIVTAQTTSAGLNAVAFQGTKTAELAGETLATGEIDTEKAKNIVASAEGLFKFGYVGGAISGPLGMQVKGLTTKLLNSKPIINQILTKGITNRPAPLTSVLKDISEHSEAIGEVLKFGTEFGINAGYMAYDEGVSYTDAMANLAQMDGVSKMVLAMLGAKNMAFLTPEKVQQVKTDLAGYKVSITAYKGQKAYSVVDAQGKETKLASPEELFMFILDKEAQSVGIKAEVKKGKTLEGGISDNELTEVAPFAKRLLKSPTVEDLTNPEIKTVKLENGEINAQGEFVSDGTYTKAETPFGKKETFKTYTDGDKKLATNVEELALQYAQYCGKNKASKGDLNCMQHILNQHKEVSAQDISEIILDFNHATEGRDSSRDGLFSYRGLERIKDLKNFKANIALFDKFMTELKASNVDSEVLYSLRNIRMDFMSESLSQLKPEEFKKNLETFKNLDSEIQKGSTYRESTWLLNQHSPEELVNLEVANEFNKWIATKRAEGKENLPYFASDAFSFARLPQEKVAQAKQNVELVKEMVESGERNLHLMCEILSSYGETSRYTDLCARMKSELGEKFDIQDFAKVCITGYNDRGNYNYDFPVTLVKNSPESFKALQVYELRNLTEKFGKSSPEVQEAMLIKAEILKDVPTFAKYNNNYSNIEIINFLEKDIPNIKDFAKLAKIASDAYFNKCKLENFSVNEQMLECVKLHLELPKDFIEYLKSDKSLLNRTWNGESEFQFNTEPEVLKQRVDIINKYKDNFSNENLEYIYNGRLDKVSADGVQMISELKSDILKDHIIKFNNGEAFEGANKETLEKFKTLANNSEITDEDLSNFFSDYSRGKALIKNAELLTKEELDAFSFGTFANVKGEITSTFWDVPSVKENIQRNVAMTPKKIRDLLKNNHTMAKLYTEMYSDKQIAGYQATVKYLDKLSAEELKDIGENTVSNILEENTRLSFETKINENNFEVWKKLPQEVKDKLKADNYNSAYHFLVSKNNYDLKECNKIVEQAKNVGVYDELAGYYLQTILKNDFNMNELIFAISKDKNFDKTNCNSLVWSINNFVGENKDIDFIKQELMGKVDSNELSNLLNAFSSNSLVKANQIDIYKTLSTRKDVSTENIIDIFRNVHRTNKDFAKNLCAKQEFPVEHIKDIIHEVKSSNVELADFLCNNKDFPKEHISQILKEAFDVEYANDLCKNYEKYGIETSDIAFLLKNQNEITLEQFKGLQEKVGNKTFRQLSENDIIVGSQVYGLIGSKNINEIPLSEKRSVLKQLVACNANLFGASEKLKKLAPLIPTTQQEYCELLPSIVRSLGVETNKLGAEQIKNTNTSTKNLANSLAQISDKDFTKLNISQENSREEFINTVIEKTKDLPDTERQKVFDYYGFELLKNDTNKTGYTLYGYPVNLNNGHKLAEISDVKTKAVVEDLRSDVVRFSKNNRIKCENPQIEQFLNEIVEVLPEMRTMIGKAQHGNNGTRGAHDYDVMKHSLKVMQKISQDPKFAKLNESDQKVMMLASLMHDITKLEGHPDGMHAENGAFDVFFIAKKFNLTPEEETKLYKICKYHEWLNFVNTSKSESELTKRLQSVAFDLQQDNLVDMAEIFTHADLRAVKTDDSFHDTKVGKSRVDFNGNVRSFGESADVYVARIKEYQKELQKSQPILPVTKFPQASRMKQAITTVNADGSTNLKGVYQDKDGVVVIKFNEMTDESWEAIGFPKGTSAKGVKAKGLNNKGAENDVETGNIHFFVHGLEYQSQLAKFDAFSLVDSDALLSVSYAERPESKYRFFRSQGVLLDIPTKYVYGGGNTDSGSGCGKNIQTFKDDYIFGGYREKDRLYISNLVKEATGMSDAEYVQFVKENENKSMLEIEPANIREKIIQKFATINSNVRKGNREYNEMYGSNPQVMGVFAYSWEREVVGQPIDFLNNVDNRTHFLKEYAKERDLPFIVFGD